MITRRTFIFSTPLVAAPASNLQVGAQTNAWRDPDDFDGLIALLDRLKKLGYQSFETNVRNVQKQAANADGARARIRQTGVRLFSAHVGMQAKFEALEAAVDVAAACGAEHLVLSGGGIFARPKLTDQEIREKTAYLNRAGKYCGDKRMRLACHNHQQEFQENGSQMERLVRDTDPGLVWFLLDGGWAAAGGGDPAKFLEQHSKRIVALHVRDYRGKQPAALGEGEFAARRPGVRAESIWRVE